MDLAPYVNRLHDQLDAAAQADDEATRAIVERLSGSLDSAVVLCILEALTEAAAEITRDLAPGSVEVRLRGREPEFAVVPPPAPQSEKPVTPEDAAWPTADEDAAPARINLRLPPDLKGRVEQAARQSGMSVNTWLVRAAAAGLSVGTDVQSRKTVRGSDVYRGWSR